MASISDGASSDPCACAAESHTTHARAHRSPMPVVFGVPVMPAVRDPACRYYSTSPNLAQRSPSPAALSALHCWLPEFPVLRTCLPGEPDGICNSATLQLCDSATLRSSISLCAAAPPNQRSVSTHRLLASQSLSPCPHYLHHSRCRLALTTHLHDAISLRRVPLSSEIGFVASSSLLSVTTDCRGAKSTAPVAEWR
ncbi:uncharacterized protein EKO05_0005870 [Ascochyta rabiei]|uniref:uncharacterized protein n=1 Tax=Didymella rabiei TaxID=5454 RepID=UPI002209BDFF|nr:uncharacterized protein EKO05_0005870 [Ascochyta rabiei]UPX15423.1 hypothetical protein EKO05_0005870 [Ascochyta rabiei]